ncbi:hypothetical protein BKA63DRAFT_12686 [Paraphoma chrysanthemicola]|nr:hypothetical protein BKA63DRAFT_12686 [Paraphoma chrysanthemicola]
MMYAGVWGLVMGMVGLSSMRRAAGSNGRGAASDWRPNHDLRRNICSLHSIKSLNVAHSSTWSHAHNQRQSAHFKMRAFHTPRADSNQCIIEVECFAIRGRVRGSRAHVKPDVSQTAFYKRYDESHITLTGATRYWVLPVGTHCCFAAAMV